MSSTDSGNSATPYDDSEYIPISATPLTPVTSGIVFTVRVKLQTIVKPGNGPTVILTVQRAANVDGSVMWVDVDSSILTLKPGEIKFLPGTDTGQTTMTITLPPTTPHGTIVNMRIVATNPANGKSTSTIVPVTKP